jgi:protein-S-isoprenylcysteine O-methyltransferase Ste14
VTSGPYRLVRNPMYTGGLLACIGHRGRRAFHPLCLTPGALFLWHVGAEDALMTQQFPDEHPAYSQGSLCERASHLPHAVPGRWL